MELTVKSGMDLNSSSCAFTSLVLGIQCVLPHPNYVLLGIKPRASGILSSVLPTALYPQPTFIYSGFFLYKISISFENDVILTW